MGKLDQFMEFANRLGVNGVEQTQNVPGKKKRKKRYKSLSSKRQECDKKLNVESDQMENEMFAEDLVASNKESGDEDFKEEIGENMDDVVNSDIEFAEKDDVNIGEEEDIHDEDIDMTNLEAEDDEDLVDGAIEEVEEEDEEDEEEEEVEEVEVKEVEDVRTSDESEHAFDLNLETKDRAEDDVSDESDEDVDDIVIDGQAELGDLMEKDLIDLEEDEDDKFNGWDEFTIERAQRKKEDLEAVIQSERIIEELEAFTEEENEINKWIPLNAEFDNVKEEYTSANDWNHYEEEEKDSFEELIGVEEDIVQDEDGFENSSAEDEPDMQQTSSDNEDFIEEDSNEDANANAEPTEDDNATIATDSTINEDIDDEDEDDEEEESEEEDVRVQPSMDKVVDNIMNTMSNITVKRFTKSQTEEEFDANDMDGSESEEKNQEKEEASEESEEEFENDTEEMDIKRETDFPAETFEGSNQIDIDEEDQEFLNSIAQMVPSNQCNICFKVFTASGSVGEHKLAVHERVKFPCDLCKYSASSKRNLRGHMTRKHQQSSGEKIEPKAGHMGEVDFMQIADSEQEFNFMDEETRILKNVKARIKLLIQPLDETLSCKKCGKCVPKEKKWSLYRHAEKHLEGVAIPCNLCGVVSPSIITLQKHKAKTHKTKRLKSLTEDASNETKEDMQEDSGDLIIDNNAGFAQNTDAEMDHSCNQCGKKTASLKQLMKHGKKHHPGTRFDCKECTNNFSSYGHLSRHIQDVHEGREFPCNQCDFQTTTNNKLVRHVKKIHSI